MPKIKMWECDLLDISQINGTSEVVSRIIMGGGNNFSEIGPSAYCILQAYELIRHRRYKCNTVMKDKIHELDPEKAKKVLIDILDVYLDKGFGVMNKTEIETLLYHVLKRNNLLSGKCFDDSFALQITEAKARKLIYESQIRYGTTNKDELLLYLRKSVGKCLTHAYFGRNNKEIRFAIEDKYLRVALHAQLRAHDFFADTSFNTDIVSMDENAFARMVTLLVPNYQVDDVLAKVDSVAISEETKAKTGEGFWSSLAKDLMVAGAVEGLKKVGSWMVTLAPAVAAL